MWTSRARSSSAQVDLGSESVVGAAKSPASRRNYQDHLKGFYAWAVDEEYIETNPVAKLAPVPVAATVPRPITETDPCSTPWRPLTRG